MTFVSAMIKIRCVIEGITFQNQENGWSVLKVRVKDYSEPVTLVGSILDEPVGVVLLCEGNWKIDRKYGRQFEVKTYEEVMPATAYGIEKYLGSGLVKGIGPKFAHLIVERFGTDTIAVIEDDIERLYEVSGIGKKRVEKIRESWEKQKDIKNVMLFLQQYGVSTGFAAKIYRQYGKESIDTVNKNPYKLADDIWGIGFKTADGIASKMGYEKNDLHRCRSGLLYTLNELADEGHVFALEDQLVSAAVKLLEADEEPIRSALSDMLKSEDLIAEGDAIYLPPFYYSEKGTARKLLNLVQAKSPALFDGPLDINGIQKSSGIEYDDILFFIRNDDPEQVAGEIVKLVRDRLPKAYGQPLNNIQVLTPMQRSVVGAGNLNILLQEALNHNTTGISRGGYTYKFGDRVMQIRNNYDKNVFNGDIGIVAKVDLEDRTLTIDFDGRMVEYDATELDEVTLAYATTIHKSQGSEYPIVVIPVLMTHFVMLQRNLIYTGITRAKKICVLIGQTKALYYAVRNLTVSKRNTLLKEMLRGTVGEADNTHITPVQYSLPDSQYYSMVAESEEGYGK